MQNILICGHPKSGTTLLASLLDGHSEIAVFPEETFLYDTISFWKLSVGDMADWLIHESAVNHLSLGRYERELDGNFDYSGFDYSEFEKIFLEKMRTQDHPGYKHLLPALVTAYAQVSGQADKKYWVEKTPGHEKYLQALIDWYPGMKVLYIIRDPRDTYSSNNRKKQRQSAGKETLKLGKFIYRWGMSVWYMQYFQQQSGNGLILRYEDLLRYPASTMSLVMDFLGLKYEPVLTTPTKFGQPWHGNSMFKDKFSAISTAPIGRWKDSLTGRQVSTIESLLGKIMSIFNYQVSTSKRSFISSLSALNRKKQLLGMLFRLYWPLEIPQRLKPISCSALSNNDNIAENK